MFDSAILAVGKIRDCSANPCFRSQTHKVLAMRLKAVLLLTLIVLAGAMFFVVVYYGQLGSLTGSDRKEQTQQPKQKEQPAAPPVGPTPVALNRGPEVAAGFQGDVHPLLFGHTQLEVTATWTTVGKGRDQLHRDLNPTIYSWFTELRPARPRQIRTERDFSAFLPKTMDNVGQVWALDADKMAAILKQFHPRPSLHLVASGRRAGPDGAFAILRAVSPLYYDIVFRIHAEFYLTPDDWPANRPVIRAWYTPAYFSGKLLVNRQTGIVDCFRLALATDKALNVHLTVEAKGIGDTRQAHDIVRVEQMELAGGGPVAEQPPWTKEIPLAAAEHRLANVFYKFLDIDWLPFDEVVAQARRRGRPIFAVVSWGSFQDQSC
ncbi:MAG TPA: hypothetical protein VGZ47_12260 [Gemmataceae bacterium]|nr:hypothetical protein [Gemmataceae bacterium]